MQKSKKAPKSALKLGRISLIRSAGTYRVSKKRMENGVEVQLSEEEHAKARVKAASEWTQAVMTFEFSPCDDARDWVLEALDADTTPEAVKTLLAYQYGVGVADDAIGPVERSLHGLPTTSAVPTKDGVGVAFSRSQTTQEDFAEQVGQMLPGAGDQVGAMVRQQNLSRAGDRVASSPELMAQAAAMGMDPDKVQELLRSFAQNAS
jgi:hypothetical protein